jgi:pilus assembly protein CpaB
LKIGKGLLIVGLLLGLATAFILYTYLNTLQDPIAAAVPHSDVVIAKNTIPAHTRISADMLEVRSYPVDMIHPEAGRDISLFVGGIARSEIVRGEQILSSRVYTEERSATLSYRIPENMRAVAIPVNEVTGVAGYITPGDTVDVLLTIENEEINDGAVTTFTLLQKISVLAIGELPREVEDDESRLVSTVTLMVTPEQAEVLAFSYRSGSFHLVLRSPVDETVVTLDAYGISNFDDFRRR